MEFGGSIGVVKLVLWTLVVKLVVKLVLWNLVVAWPVVAVAYWRCNEARPGCLR